MPLIEIEDFSLSYQHQTCPSLSNINLSIEKGEAILITGHSACGKSSLLRALNGIVPHIYPAQLSGKLKIAEHIPAQTPIHQLGRQIGMIYQNPRMQFFCRNVREELAFARENAGENPSGILHDINHYSQALNIQDLLERNLWTLSSGERQRVAIAAALVDKAPILLFDEPSANLDTESIIQLRNLLPSLTQRGITILIAEHRCHFFKGIVHRVITMKQGNIISNQKAEDYWQETPTEAFLSPLPSSPLKPQLSYHAPNQAPFTCARGSITAVIGANGSGKTTLLRTLAGLNKTNYPIMLNGKAMKANQLMQHSFLVMQDIPRQLFAAKVCEEITLPQRKLNQQDKERLEHYLKVFSIAHQAHQHPQALSAGEQQRVLLAAALYAQRNICLLDEPTSGLDAYSTEQLCQELRKLTDKGNIVIVATHDPSLIAYANHIYRLNKHHHD